MNSTSQIWDYQTLQTNGYYNTLSKCVDTKPYQFEKIYITHDLYIPYSEFEINENKIEIKEPVMEINGRVVNEKIPLFCSDMIKSRIHIYESEGVYISTCSSGMEICYSLNDTKPAHKFPLGNDNYYYIDKLRIAIQLLTRLSNMNLKFKIKISNFDYLLISARKISITPINDI